jgi:hypothetical protein
MRRRIGTDVGLAGGPDATGMGLLVVVLLGRGMRIRDVVFCGRALSSG